MNFGLHDLYFSAIWVINILLDDAALDKIVYLK